MEDTVTEIGDTIQSVLSLQTSSIQADEISSSGGRYFTKPFYIRCRFAQRFDGNFNSNESVEHADNVREAFNSPFYPFVLASTSVGQEGLDFHTWCHSVMHWNLPPNPVDLEQREGRVHRYKGHAVRKNVAEYFGINSLRIKDLDKDPWEALFEIASRKFSGKSDLVPYWIFEKGSARIQRLIPILPFSIEEEKIKNLKKSLSTLYRMVFGQPNQEDLLESLKSKISPNSKNIKDWLISLEPPELNKSNR